MSEKIMIVISGNPGSGKSTLADLIAPGINATICCTDDLCMVDGQYQFDPKLANERHQKNFENAEECCKSGKNIIIPNTNCSKRNYLIYEELGKDYGYVIHHIYLKPNIEESIQRNLHNVPVETIKAMSYALVKDFSEHIHEKELKKFEFKRKIKNWKNKIYYKYLKRYWKRLF